VHANSMQYVGPVIAAGIAVASLGVGARLMFKTIPEMSKRLAGAAAQTEMPKINLDPAAFAANSKYYKHGFQAKMTPREAALILGVHNGAPPKRVKEAYKVLMGVHHPDKGGSPYLGTKITEAKEMLLKK